MTALIELLQVAKNAQPLADNAADKMDEAAHVAATRTVEVTDAAAEDIQRVAHATGQAGVQATKDVSKVRFDIVAEQHRSYTPGHMCET